MKGAREAKGEVPASSSKPVERRQQQIWREQQIWSRSWEQQTGREEEENAKRGR